MNILKQEYFFFLDKSHIPVIPLMIVGLLILFSYSLLLRIKISKLIGVAMA